jgi:hypothetical protein
MSFTTTTTPPPPPTTTFERFIPYHSGIVQGDDENGNNDNNTNKRLKNDNDGTLLDGQKRLSIREFSSALNSIRIVDTTRWPNTLNNTTEQQNTSIENQIPNNNNNQNIHLPEWDLITSIEFESTNKMDWVSGEDGKKLAGNWIPDRVGESSSSFFPSCTSYVSTSGPVEWGKNLIELHKMLQDGTCDRFFALDEMNKIAILFVSPRRAIVSGISTSFLRYELDRLEVEYTYPFLANTINNNGRITPKTTTLSSATTTTTVMTNNNNNSSNNTMMPPSTTTITPPPTDHHTEIDEEEELRAISNATQLGGGVRVVSLVNLDSGAKSVLAFHSVIAVRDLVEVLVQIALKRASTGSSMMMMSTSSTPPPPSMIAPTSTIATSSSLSLPPTLLSTSPPPLSSSSSMYGNNNNNNYVLIAPCPFPDCSFRSPRLTLPRPGNRAALHGDGLKREECWRTGLYRSIWLPSSASHIENVFRDIHTMEYPNDSSLVVIRTTHPLTRNFSVAISKLKWDEDMMMEQQQSDQEQQDEELLGLNIRE